jgi:putative tricarboxylic transport membrane protein
VLILCVIGAYAINNSMFDVWVMLGFGVFGFVMRRYDFEPAPVVLGLVLGKVLENSLRQSMVILEGDLSGLLGRPISAALMLLAVVAVAGPPLVRLLMTLRRQQPSPGNPA